MSTILPMSAARVFFDGIFSAPRVAHPEGVAVHADGSIWCGNELGDLLRIAADGSGVERMGTTGGFALGIAFDSRGNCVICDLRHAAVFRYDAVAGRVDKFVTSGILVPNYPVVDEARGVLYVSDSRGNMAMAPDGQGLYVVESDRAQVSYVPINDDGSAGAPRLVVGGVNNVPDGLAFAPDGTLYISCYEPSRIYRLKPGGTLETLIEDPAATAIAHPTNIALKGDKMYTANLGRWHITEISLT